MEHIILIETSTALCSAALTADEGIISYRESSEPKAHASMTAVFIKEILDENGLSVNDCDAICVSKGPGSYTGLRVGVSTAKGLCFGAKKPLISVGTLDTLVYQAIADGLVPEGCKHIVPMIDARRMEVYTSIFSPDGTPQAATQPLIIDENSFSDILEDGPVLFIGDGAGKCEPVLSHPNATFVQCCPRASSMLVPARAALKEKRLEDVAYFEPFYLKEFITTTPKKKFF